MGKNGVKLVIAILLIAVAGVVAAYTTGLIGGGGSESSEEATIDPSLPANATQDEIEEHYNEDPDSTQRVMPRMSKPSGRRL